MRYDYYNAVKDDVINYITDHYTPAEIRAALDCSPSYAFHDQLHDELWIEDGVTGNASGSYTFNAWQAEENICHNLDLLGEALEEFGCGPDYLAKHGAEAADVTIRCYLLSGAIWQALEELEEELEDSETE